MSAASRGPLGSFQVGPGMWVRLRYRAFDSEGMEVEASAHELAYVHGYGALLEPLEAALERRRSGETCSVTLDEHDAFGPRRAEAIVEFERTEFPPDISPGDHFEAERQDGGVLVLRVLDVLPDAVVVDTNHPLAGQSVRFELTIEEVRPATSEELAQAESSIREEKSANEPLVPVERLLRGPSQRYELGRPSQDGPRPPRPDDEN